MLNLKYKQKYLKYKNKYLQLKSQIGGEGVSYLWYADNVDKKFSLVNIYNNPMQNLVSRLYKQYLTDNRPIDYNGVQISSQNDIKYYGQKLLKVDFDYKYFNIGIKMFKLPYCMNFIEKYLYDFFNLSNIDLISVGSGNGLFEKCCVDVFGKEIICIDPAPLSFASDGLRTSFREPTFATVDDYLKSPSKKDNSILLLIWTDPTLIYDIDAILKLNPLSFFIIYGQHPLAGSEELRASLYSDSQDFTLRGKNYKKIADNIGFGSFLTPFGENVINIRMSVCINSTKINKSDIHETYEKSQYDGVIATYPYLKRDLLAYLLDSRIGEYEILQEYKDLKRIDYLELNSL